MTRVLHTTCCVVGGGPAGMMLGYLLARSGVETVVLEKHGDFLRDFRGDTLHPSTLALMGDLGLLDEFLTLPHDKLDRMTGRFGGHRIQIADLRRVHTRCRYIAFMPQWDFLDFLARKGRELPKLTVTMQARVDDLIRQDGRVAGVRATTPEGEIEVRADLTVGCDGRTSTVREKSGLPLKDLGAPIDVLWFRIPRDPAPFDAQALGNIVPGRLVVTIDRGTYWQCAYVIRKGGFEPVKAAGLEALKADAVRAAPLLAAHIDTLTDWEQVKLLSVTLDRLTRWATPGLLCIGDAAHAMSPVGGVGINLAVQDAVAAARILRGPLKAGVAGMEALNAVQRRRQFPSSVVQAFQRQAHKLLLAPTLDMDATTVLAPPLPVRIVDRSPFLQGLFARFIGVGVRPEHWPGP